MADEEEDGNAEAMQLFGELEMDVGEVDEDGKGGAALADGSLEASEFPVDAGQVTNDFRDPHDRHVFRAHDPVETCLDHARTTHANKERAASMRLETFLHGGDEKRAIGFAAGLSGGDEDGLQIGHQSAVP